MSSNLLGRPDRLIYSPVDVSPGSLAVAPARLPSYSDHDTEADRVRGSGSGQGDADPGYGDAGTDPDSAITDPGSDVEEAALTSTSKSSRSTRSDANDASATEPRILVVGETIPGLVLAARLERGPASPTVVTRHRNESGSPSAVTLSPPAARTVDDLLEGERVADMATGGDELAVVDQEAKTRYAGPESEDPPHRIDGGRLLAGLRKSIPRSSRRRVQVERVRQLDHGVEVAFDDDERTTFDVVVAADGPTSFLGTLTGNLRDLNDGVHEWSFVVDRPPEWSANLVESWTGDALLTATPLGDDLAVRLGFTAEDGHDRLPDDLAEDVLTEMTGPIPEAIGDTLPDRSDYRRVPDPTAEPTWRVGRVAFCGDAAAPLGPLSGLAPTLGVEDAVTLARSLSATHSVENGLDRYENHRAERLPEVLAAARRDDGSGYPPATGTGPLRAIGELRTVANARFLGRDDPLADGDWPSSSN